jgi:hypothetical protein
MKSGMLVIAVLASVIAGAAGGYVAALYGAPEKGSNKVSNVTPVDMPEAGLDVKDHTDEIDRLRSDLGALTVRMQGMVDPAEYDILVKKHAELKASVDELKAGGVVVTKGPEGEIDAGSIPPAVLETAVDEVIAKREAEREAARQAERERQMEEWNKRRNDAIIERLATELSLTEVQKVNIEVALNDYAAKRRDVWVRNGQARENGEEFDFRAEMATVHTAAADAVRAELSTAQVSTFNELLGERDLESLAGRGFGGFGGNNRGGRRGGQGD